jgi:MFS family permease
MLRSGAGHVMNHAVAVDEDAVTNASVPAAERRNSTLMSLLLAVLLLVFATNLQGVLLPILGHARGATMLTVGLFSSGWSTGFVVACACIGQVLGRLGHARSFGVLALLSSACGSMLYLVPNDLCWILLRVVIGFCYGGLSAIVEGWLVEVAGSGSGFAAYMTVNLLASLGGTLSLDLIGMSGPVPFGLPVVALVLSAAAIALGRVPHPPVPPPFRPRLGVLLSRSPVGAVSCLCAGVVTGVIGGLAPVFGMASGLRMSGTTEMLAANSLGGALAILPLARLSARLGHTRLLALLLPFGMLCCVPLSLLPSLSPLGAILALGVFGFVQYPLYGLGVAIANTELADRPPSEIAGELLLLFGAGTILGPVVGAELLGFGTVFLFCFVAAMLAVPLLALAVRRRAR